MLGKLDEKKYPGFNHEKDARRRYVRHGSVCNEGIVGRGAKGEKKLVKYSFFEAARNFAEKFDGRIVDGIRKRSKKDVSMYSTL